MTGEQLREIIEDVGKDPSWTNSSHFNDLPYYKNHEKERINERENTDAGGSGGETTDQHGEGVQPVEERGN